jgi:hypothetical protein
MWRSSNAKNFNIETTWQKTALSHRTELLLSIEIIALIFDCDFGSTDLKILNYNIFSLKKFSFEYRVVEKSEKSHIFSRDRKPTNKI